VPVTANVLMSSLPPSYNTACLSVNASTHLTKSKITPDTFQAFILDKYELCELRTGKKDAKDEAFTADANKKKPKKDIECHNFHKRRHVKADCWAKGSRKEGQGLKRNSHATASVAAATEEKELEAWAATEEDSINYNQ
jgi:hypothetical protein